MANDVLIVVGNLLEAGLLSPFESDQAAGEVFFFNTACIADLVVDLS